MISLNKLVLEILTENDGKANFTKIFEVLITKVDRELPSEKDVIKKGFLINLIHIKLI